MEDDYMMVIIPCIAEIAASDTPERVKKLRLGAVSELQRYLHYYRQLGYALTLLSVHRGFGTLPKGLPQQAIACEGTSNFQPTRRSAGGRKYGSGYPLPMLAILLFAFFHGKNEEMPKPNAEKKKHRNLRCSQWLYFTKKRGILFPRSFIFDFLYCFRCGGDNCQILVVHAVKQCFKLPPLCGLICFLVWKKELVY